MSEQVIWGIHGGVHGEGDALFTRRNFIAIGWREMGDLSQWRDRDEYKAAYAEKNPDAHPMAVAITAGQLYRFVHEMQRGDFVVYPSKPSREVHIGKVAGEYQYSPDVNAQYPNMRKVEWLKTVPRTNLSQGALYEMGSAMTLFQIRSYVEEILAILEGVPVEVSEEDETIGVVAADIEEQTRDFVLKQLTRRFKGHPLSDFVAHLLEKMGYKTRVSTPGPDHGIDIVAHRDELGFEPPLVKVQVKSSEGSVAEPDVSALYGKVGEKEYGLLVTLGTFTAQARNFAFSKGNLRLIDGKELVDLTFNHYDELDPRYKAIIPLKRVYVPEALSEE